MVPAASNRPQPFGMSSARPPQVDYPPYGLSEGVKKLEEWIQVRGTDVRRGSGELCSVLGGSTLD